MNRRELLGLALGLALPSPAMAFPERPIRLIVPFAPGGDGDLMGRMWARYAAVHLGGGGIVVENRAGAGGAIGATEVARARGDGHVLLLGTSTTQIINPATLPTAPYDALKDFSLVGMLSVTPTCIVVNPGVPAGSLKELVALLKANPGKYSYGSAGPGTVTNLTGELLKHQAGLQMVHVPYKGGGPALTDLLGGHISMLFPTMTIALPHVNAGKLRALAVIAPRRSSALPDVPTMAESGYPGVTMTSWYGVVAPAATPQPVIDRMSAEITKILNMPDVKERFATQFAEPVYGTPAAFGKLIVSEIATWTTVAKAGGIKAE